MMPEVQGFGPGYGPGCGPGYGPGFGGIFGGSRILLIFLLVLFLFDFRY